MKAHMYILLLLIYMRPSGARTLKAVKAPNTAGAINDNHLCSQGGNSKRDRKATGSMRGRRLTTDTPMIISHILVSLIEQHP